MIRPFRQGDTDAVIDIWYRASLVAHHFLSDDFLRSERALMTAEWLPNSDTTVAEVKGEVVGFLSLVGDEVGGLFVAPEHHRGGIGTQLMNDARQRRVNLDVEVFEDNEHGRRFYAAYGFEEIGRGVHEQTGLGMLRLRLV